MKVEMSKSVLLLTRCNNHIIINIYSKYDLSSFPQMGHSMSSQPPNRRHVADFAEILHTIWDRKKKSQNPKMSVLRPSEAEDMAPESFR